MLSDIEIAQQAKMLKITEVAAKLGIPEEEITKFGGNSYMLVGKTKTGEEA